MRVGIVSDIHSNLPALQAVLGDMGPVDQLWCLGDTVGYGPYANEVIQLLRRLDCHMIPGNHDWGATGKVPLDDFNVDARRACQWTWTVLTEENRLFLDSLPLTRTFGDFTLAHGTPQEPIWEYMAYPSTASLAFHYFSTRYCLVGHTHVPLVFFDRGERGPASLIPTPSTVIELDETRAIV
ncbi:MAG: metallophosphoesterase, partial [Chloroflexota bacterium]|nr:metallophosphoesterase [Chloroflexota bacterium]